MKLGSVFRASWSRAVVVVGLFAWVATAGSGCSTRDTAPPRGASAGRGDSAMSSLPRDAGPQRDAPGVDAPMSTTDGGAIPDPGVCLGGPARGLGESCGCANDCGSGSCSDGVCCNVACDGACVACNVEGKAGECSPIPDEMPDPLCSVEPESSCGRSGLCNGMGGCARHPSGTVCKPGSCSGNSQVPKSVCDGNGTCLTGAALTCMPFLCKGDGCNLSCANDADCVGEGVRCINGSCGKRPLGALCSTANDCKSGVCADGVCCDKACDGKCNYCAFPSSLGRCTAAPAGIPDPKMICKNEKAQNACGTNGLCDGNGGCQKYPDGTVCKGSACEANASRWTPEHTCQSGACTAPMARACSPFKCSGTRCATSCTRNDQCTAGNSCVNGSCGKLPNGATCSSNNQCSSNTCAQGVCCNAACDGTCFSCKLAGKVGTCTVVPEGQADPLERCQDQGASSCKNDGFCDGKGACRQYEAGTQCASQSCSVVSNVATKFDRAVCDGKGTCTRGAAKTCAPYVCNQQGTDCYNTCTQAGTGSPECAGGVKCLNGRCDGKLRKGQDCTETSECESGLSCVDGVCCDKSACGTCQACNLAGDLGSCANLAGGTVDGDCPVDSVSRPCGNTGRCNGSGSCELRAANTVCGARSCTTESGGNEERICDGAGACTARSGGATFTCGSNRCVGTACLPCSGDDDCLGGAKCFDGQCGAGSALGVSCSADRECASNFCADGRCCDKACKGACERCNSAGVCTAVASGSDDNCPDERATNACGRTGQCSSGVCQRVANGAECGSSCSGNSTVTATCSGGACTGTGATTSCGNQVCRPGSGSGGAACVRCDASGAPACPAGTVCTSSGSCRLCDPGLAVGANNCPAATPHCMGGTACTRCVPGMMTGCGANQLCNAAGTACIDQTLGLGAVCTTNAQCASGSCVDGVCCNSACSGSCQRCGSDGMCGAAPDGADDTCRISEDTCGSRGCQAGACIMGAPAGTPCGDMRTCSGEAESVEQTCDGAGSCVGNAVPCAQGYRCDSSTKTCNSACMNNGDCATNWMCMENLCVPRMSSEDAGAPIE